jgi:hypothetical protein
MHHFVLQDLPMLRSLLLLLAIALVIGCEANVSKETSQFAPTPNAAADLDYAYGDMGKEVAIEKTAPPEADNRKIIYTASLSVVVKDFSGVERSITELVKK